MTSSLTARISDVTILLQLIGSMTHGLQLQPWDLPRSVWKSLIWHVAWRVHVAYGCVKRRYSHPHSGYYSLVFNMMRGDLGEGTIGGSWRGHYGADFQGRFLQTFVSIRYKSRSKIYCRQNVVSISFNSWTSRRRCGLQTLTQNL